MRINTVPVGRTERHPHNSGVVWTGRHWKALNDAGQFLGWASTRIEAHARGAEVLGMLRCYRWLYDHGYGAAAEAVREHARGLWYVDIRELRR